jgi:hypothetical protein
LGVEESLVCGCWSDLSPQTSGPGHTFPLSRISIHRQAGCGSATSGLRLGSVNEWHRRREAPARKHSSAVSRSQLFRGLPKCRDEPGIGDPELLVHRRAHRMEQRCWRSLRTRRSIVRMLPSDGRSSQRLVPCSGPRVSRLADLANQIEIELSPFFGR